jgi:hypothetical protein
MADSFWHTLYNDSVPTSHRTHSVSMRHTNRWHEIGHCLFSDSYEEHKNCDQEADWGNNCRGVLSKCQKHMHNQKNPLVHTLALGSVIQGVEGNLIVRLSTYQHFEGDGGILLTNGSCLSRHIYGNPGLKIHPCMALQPLPGLGLPQSAPPLVPVFSPSPPSSYS